MGDRIRRDTRAECDAPLGPSPCLGCAELAFGPTPWVPIEARFMAVDRKVRTIALSVKAKEAHEEAEAMQNYRSDSTTGTSLGDLLKEQISGQ